LQVVVKEMDSVLTDPSKITVMFQPWSPVIDWDLVPEQPVKLFMQASTKASSLRHNLFVFYQKPVI